MDDTKRRAMIKSKAAKKKDTSDVDPKGTAQAIRPQKGSSCLKGTILPRNPKSL